MNQFADIAIAACAEERYMPTLVFSSQSEVATNAKAQLIHYQKLVCLALTPSNPKEHLIAPMAAVGAPKSVVKSHRCKEPLTWINSLELPEQERPYRSATVARLE